MVQFSSTTFHAWSWGVRCPSCTPGGSSNGRGQAVFGCAGWSKFDADAAARWMSELDMAGQLWAIFGACHNPPTNNMFGNRSVLQTNGAQADTTHGDEGSHLDIHGSSIPGFVAFRGLPGQTASFDPYLGAARAWGIQHSCVAVLRVASWPWWAADQLRISCASAAICTWFVRQPQSVKGKARLAMVCRMARCTERRHQLQGCLLQVHLERRMMHLGSMENYGSMSWVESKKTLSKTEFMPCALTYCGNQKSLAADMTAIRHPQMICREVRSLLSQAQVAAETVAALVETFQWKMMPVCFAALHWWIHGLQQLAKHLDSRQPWHWMTSDVVTSKHVQCPRGLRKFKHRHQCRINAWPRFITLLAIRKDLQIPTVAEGWRRSKQLINGRQIAVVHLHLKIKLVYCGGSELFRNRSLYKEKEATFETLIMIFLNTQWYKMAGASLYRLRKCDLDVAKLSSSQWWVMNPNINSKQITLTAGCVLPFVVYDLFKNYMIDLLDEWDNFAFSCCR